ncbi:hypothetical protein [Sulfuriroseicoccus oceanibius]|uniref:Uncharacterized protein n=1 Tax=Sulfuriroseicoccus oceanibius TaxID=2707525 RepID=A0A7T7F0U5_9BACT|nr:hypothetical protein [Sulfuriroseicoccus oceanibius]QQL44608.1 hypothetical protein G3M56_012055 [Sulfuriroseicoccus oceanibius]
MKTRIMAISAVTMMAALLVGIWHRSPIFPESQHGKYLMVGYGRDVGDGEEGGMKVMVGLDQGRGVSHKTVYSSGTTGEGVATFRVRDATDDHFAVEWNFDYESSVTGKYSKSGYYVLSYETHPPDQGRIDLSEGYFIVVRVENE